MNDFLSYVIFCCQNRPFPAETAMKYYVKSKTKEAIRKMFFKKNRHPAESLFKQHKILSFEKQKILALHALCGELHIKRPQQVILGQNFIRLSDAALDDFFFFKNLFYQKQFKYAMNIRVAQIGGVLL